MTSKRHTTLYRSYRPQKLSELVGQKHISDVLEKTLKEKKIAHAYLFSGPRGTGKTSTARIMATEIGCSPIDIIEIDAASHRKIDDVRKLQAEVHTQPFQSPYRVYIIDEVHMMTTEAFNALLKTLEEPPSYVIFILATTELDQVPETIKSRCQHFSFKKPSQEVLKNHIEKIAKQEGFTLGGESAEMISISAEGSFRDALGILEKVIVGTSGNKIDDIHVANIVGAPSHELVMNIVSALDEKNPELGLQAIHEAEIQSLDMEFLARLVIHHVRSILLLRFTKFAKETIEENEGEDHATVLEKIAKNKKTNITSDTLLQFLTHMPLVKGSELPHIAFEAVFLKLISTDKD